MQNRQPNDELPLQSVMSFMPPHKVSTAEEISRSPRGVVGGAVSPRNYGDLEFVSSPRGGVGLRNFGTSINQPHLYNAEQHIKSEIDLGDKDNTPLENIKDMDENAQ